MINLVISSIKKSHVLFWFAFFGMIATLVITGCSPEVKVAASDSLTNPSPSPTMSVTSDHGQFYEGMKVGVHSFLSIMDDTLKNFDEWKTGSRLESEIQQLARVLEDLLRTTQFIPITALTKQSTLEITKKASSDAWSITFSSTDVENASGPIRVVENARFWLIDNARPYPALFARTLQDHENELVTHIPSGAASIPADWDPLKSDPSFQIGLDRVVPADDRLYIRIYKTPVDDAWSLLSQNSFIRVDLTIRELEFQHPIKQFYVIMDRARVALSQGGNSATSKALLTYFRDRLTKGFDNTRVPSP